MSNESAESNTVRYRKSIIEDPNSIRVIGAGLPRTGTSSLKNALEILGFGPCHHMTELLNKPEQGKIFLRLFDGHEVHLRNLFKEYGSSVDAPTALFYEKLHEVYPKAKLILTIRDSDEEWFECFQQSISTIWLNDLFFFMIYPLRNLRTVCVVARRMSKIWISEYGKIGPHIHKLHNTRVIKQSKPDQLLVFNVKEGWAPLCQFLNVPIPDEIEFPNTNYPAYVKNRLCLARIVGTCVWLFCLMMIIIFIYILSSLIGG